MNQYREQQLLKKICTLGIGGHAKYYTAVHSIKEMQDTLRSCREKNLRYFILGKGSNTLFDDRGFDGLVIHNKIDFCAQPEEGLFYTGAGYSFSLLGAQTARKGWSGLEFASGIPGTVGGAVFMNAGANGRETQDSLVSAEFVDDEGQLHLFRKEELDFQYRFSSFQRMRGAIVSATFRLTPCKEARKNQLKIIEYRTQTQPYGEKSAGCIFRNPPDAHAGELIEKCGLKGFSIGGATVSAKHGNFLVNNGEGSSRELLQLIAQVQETVYRQTGIRLESEVRLIPYQENDS